MKKDIFKELFFAYLRELYANSIGFDGKAGDFDYLMEHKTIAPDGRPTIAMDDYYISQEQFEEITLKHIAGTKKLLRPYERKMFANECYLGATPTCNKEKWEQRKAEYDKN